jgi:phosphohistidine phosphatase
MKTLLLLRHAKSSWKDAALDDHDRPLNKRGKREAPRMGQLLKEENLVPDLILCSSAKRARRTAECAAQYSGYRGETRIMPELYQAQPNAIRRIVGAVSPEVDRLLVVGHNPEFEEFLESLVGRYTPLSAAALARVDLDIGDWSDLHPDTKGRLIAVWQPRELG